MATGGWIYTQRLLYAVCYTLYQKPSSQNNNEVYTSTHNFIEMKFRAWQHT